MIGTKKLSTIRTEIEDALSAAGEDPISRLDRLTETAKKDGERTEVLEGLKQFLQSRPKGKRRKQRAGK